MIFALIIPILVDSASSNTTPLGPLPRKGLSAFLDGDIMLGALMMVHQRENEPAICGDVMPQGGVQAVESMLYTLDYINREHIVPYTKLGALILDDCDKDTYGLQQSVEFIKGKMSNIQAGYTCTYVNSSTKYSIKPITGVVAASSSVTSIQVANLLKLFKIPQVSFFSSSAELSNRERFPYFFRTIPSDAWQVEAMKDIILEFNWSYVSLIYEESSYGKVAMSSLEEKLRSRNVCIGVKAALPKDSDVAQNDEYDKIVEKLLSKKRARGVVIYGSDQEVQGLVRALSRKNATNKFTFIGSDGWSGRALVYEGGYEKEVLGTISLQPQASPIRGFREYFENLTVESNVRNPWFQEMWESEFKCRYPNKPETIYNRNFSSICTGREHKTQPEGRAPYEYEQQLQFVSDATLVFAYALRDYFRKKCNNNFLCIQCHQKGPAAVIASPGAEAHDQEGCEIDGELLKSVIQSVTFESLIEGGRKMFRFESEKSDPTPKYNIIHFRSTKGLKSTGKSDVFSTDTTKNQSPSYEWVNVGTWEKDKANRLTIDYSMLEFFVKNDEFYSPSSSQNYRKGQQQQKDKKKQNQQKSVVPASYCSEKCKPWEIRIYPTEGDKCCYKCSPCPPYQHKINENQCQECPNGTKPSENVLRCVPIPEDKVEVYSSYGIICLTIAILGTASTVFLLVIFLLHNSTPIVRASGRELSYVIIFGLFLCFAVTPITLVPPSPFVCGVQRFLSGFCFTVVYAAILTKTNRIARIFKSGRRTIRRPHFISPESQLFICGGVTCLQILLIGLWLYSHPPQDVPYYPTRKDNMIVCQEAVTNRYLMAYVYPIFLCIVCTVYAYKTRKMPEAFNESHYIAAAVYTTCVIWLAFVPVYIVSKESNQIRATSVCVSTSLTAIVCQFCLFWPKVYIILFKPERNVRQALMGPKNSSVSKSLLPTTAGASGASCTTSVGAVSSQQHRHHSGVVFQHASNASHSLNTTTTTSMSCRIDRSDSSCCSDDETQMSVTKRSDLTTQILAITTKSLTVATQTEVAHEVNSTVVAAAKQQPVSSKDLSRDDTTSTSLFLADSMAAGQTSTVPRDERRSPFKLNVVHNNVGGAMKIDHLMGGTVIGGGGPAPTASPEMSWIDHEDSKINIIISASGSTTSVNPVPNIIVASESEIKWEFGDVPL